MAKHSGECSYSKHLAATRLFALLFLSVGAIALVSDTASAQQHPQARPGQRALATPVTEKTSLGQALAASNQDAVVETFALPGLKGDVTLDRRYKGRARLTCVFTALNTEAKSLTSAYAKIVDAKYPDLTTVNLFVKSSQPAISDFTDLLKSQYDSATKCAANVEQAFKDVTLANMRGPRRALSVRARQRL